MSFLDKPGSWTRVGLVPQKAATGLGVVQMTQEPKLENYRENPQEMMKKFLKAYKFGWFYKAGSAISFDVSNLQVVLKDEAGEEIPVPDKNKPFESLSPPEQCRRLLDMPNEETSWRMFIEKTIIRYDFAGNAIWYLDELDTDECPTAIYNVSPVRMYPAMRGNKVIGWVMDWNSRGGGTPFTTDEIVHLSAGSADDSVWGVGVVEAVIHEWEVNQLLPKHVADVLTLGGRLAGMVSPKERSLGEDEFQDTLRAWRSIANSGDAAKRLLVFPEPIEWTRGAATPQEIGLPGINDINRINILSAFPVAEFRLGVPLESGLNSGDTRKSMFREHWEFAIHPRAEVLRETWQHNIVDRFAKKAGQVLTIEFLEPNRDDAPQMLEKAAAFRALLNLGFDPTAIIPAVGLEKIRWDPNLLMYMIEQAFLGATEAAGQAGSPSEVPGLGSGSHVNQTKDKGTQQRNNAGNPASMVRLPNPLLAGDVGQRIFVNDSNRKDNVTVSQSVTTQRKAAVSGPGKAIVPLVTLKSKEALGTFFVDQKDRIIGKIRMTWPKQKAARKAYTEDEWWDTAAENEALRQTLREAIEEVSVAGLEEASNTLERFIDSDKSRNAMNMSWDYALQDINGINQTTKDAIRDALETGAARGYAVDQIIDGVSHENYPGVKNLMMRSGNPVWDDARAEMISRTSLMKAYNRGNLLGYGELGITQVKARDGDYDAECRDRDGRIFSIHAALEEDDHPNGTLDWIPQVTYGKAVEVIEDPRDAAIKAIAAQIQELSKPRQRRIIRDEKGRIMSIIET